LGGPSVAQGPRKDGASVRIEEVALFATKDGKRPGGGEKDRGIGTSGDPVIGKAKPYHRSTGITRIGKGRDLTTDLH
jgi:hypothetical protein